MEKRQRPDCGQFTPALLVYASGIIALRWPELNEDNVNTILSIYYDTIIAERMQAGHIHCRLHIFYYTEKRALIRLHV